MATDDFVLLAILANGGEIAGKTKVQKTVYFLGLMTDCLPQLGYRPHFYGPFSDDVAGALRRLKAIGAVEETAAATGSVDEAGFEICTYHFRLTEEGRRYAESVRNHQPDTWKRISAAAKRMNEAGEENYVLLSVAAKTYFMLGQQKGRAAESELVSLAPRFGWQVRTEQIKDAARYLQKLGLVELAAR